MVSFSDKVISKIQGTHLGGTLKLTIDEQVLSFSAGGLLLEEELAEYDCSITVSSNTLSELASGTLNPMMAYSEGRITIDGKVSVAMALVSSSALS